MFSKLTNWFVNRISFELYNDARMKITSFFTFSKSINYEHITIILTIKTRLTINSQLMQNKKKWISQMEQ